MVYYLGKKAYNINITNNLHPFICKSSEQPIPFTTTEAEFLDEIQRKVFSFFLLDIQSHLYSFALRFLFLQTHATSYSFYCVLLYCTYKGGRKET
jgi:hypothetical protein